MSLIMLATGGIISIFKSLKFGFFMIMCLTKIFITESTKSYSPIF